MLLILFDTEIFCPWLQKFRLLNRSRWNQIVEKRRYNKKRFKYKGMQAIISNFDIKKRVIYKIL